MRVMRKVALGAFDHPGGDVGAGVVDGMFAVPFADEGKQRAVAAPEVQDVLAPRQRQPLQHAAAPRLLGG